MVERLNALAAWQYIELQWSDEMKRLRAGPLLHHLLESIDNYTQANPEPHAPKSTPTATTKSALRPVQDARKPLSSSSGKKDHLKEWRGRKLHLYSAHDGTLLYALTALGLWKNGAAFGRLPPYASAFIVELHYRHARYELDFFFRNRTAPVNTSAVQLFLPGAWLALDFHFLYLLILLASDFTRVWLTSIANEFDMFQSWSKHSMFSTV